jgi:hypothetical protein
MWSNTGKVTAFEVLAHRMRIEITKTEISDAAQIPLNRFIMLPSERLNELSIHAFARKYRHRVMGTFYGWNFGLRTQ